MSSRPSFQRLNGLHQQNSLNSITETIIQSKMLGIFNERWRFSGVFKTIFSIFHLFHLQQVKTCWHHQKSMCEMCVVFIDYFGCIQYIVLMPLLVTLTSSCPKEFSCEQIAIELLVEGYLRFVRYKNFAEKHPPWNLLLMKMRTFKLQLH